MSLVGLVIARYGTRVPSETICSTRDPLILVSAVPGKAVDVRRKKREREKEEAS